MVAWFKKYFIPHEHNQHKPHILRWKASLLILGAILLVEAVFLVQVFVLFPKIKFFAEILINVLVQDTNANRLAGNLPGLKTNSLLKEAAQLKAEDMAAKSYFSHTSPEGVTPWYWFKRVGYKYSYAGENLAVNFFDSNEVVNAWMNSASHKANILNNHFTDIGIGTAKGIYEGRETIFIVQMFGRETMVPVTETSTPPEQVALKPIEPEPVNPVPVNPTENSQPQQTFIAVENAGEQSEPDVLPAEISGTPGFSISGSITRLITSPSMRTRDFYFVVLGVILFALILNIFVRIKIQHPHIIMNAVILIVIINSVLILNQYLVSVNAKVF